MSEPLPPNVSSLRRAALSAVLFSLLPACAEAQEGVRTRPNILFIMSDDHAAHAIGCYGSRVNETPRIDALASQGMRFTRMMVTNSLCAPSRAVLLTGAFSHRNGFTHNGCAFDGSQPTFPKLLQKAGYETAVVGKWHLKSQPTGFDYYSVIPGHGRYFDCSFKTTGRPWRDGVAGGEIQPGYLTDVITDRAIAWLEQRDEEKPFLLMVHHKAPHAPHDPAPRHADLFADIDIDEPPTLFDDGATRGPVARATGDCRMRDCSYPEYAELLAAHSDPIERTHIMYQVYMKGYVRLVASLDENVGRLLDHVDHAGLRENTIVIYTSDNGFFLGDHGLYNKMWMYEEALKVPLIVRWPDEIAAGTTSDAMVQNMDFAPLFLECAGAAAPDTLQGRSFLPILRGERPADWRKRIYYHYYAGYDIPEQYGIRTEDHKLVCFPDRSGGSFRELFDLASDPRELRNVHGDPDHAAKRTELEQGLAELRVMYGDTAEFQDEGARTSTVDNLARGSPVSLRFPCSAKYQGGAPHALTDGVINHPSPIWAFDFSRWQGFEKVDLDARIELPVPVRADQIEVRFLQKLDSWIFEPTEMRIEISEDGKLFTPLPSVRELKVVGRGVAKLSRHRAALDGRLVRAIRVVAKNVETCPEWHPGAGGPAWLFVDEIIVR